MSIGEQAQQLGRGYQFMLLSGIIIISLNLRPAITSVGPLLGVIRDDISLANSSAGLITSLPLVAFAVMSPFAAQIGNRYTYEGAMIIGLVILLIGMGVRSIPIVFLLFAGTFVAGLGIAILNVLLPGLIKDKFPLKVGLMTSIYTTAMGIMAATASGLSIPLAENMGLGWQGALLVWTIPAILGILIWFYLWLKREKETSPDPTQGLKYTAASGRRIWRSPLAWKIAAFMGLQSFLFYVTISWLPAIMHDNGMSMETAGWMLSFTQFVGLPFSFIVPVLAERMTSQRGLVIFLALSCFFGYGGLLVSDSFVVAVISAILIGMFLSGAFAFALTLFGLRTRTAKDAAELSGMAQSAGYVLAALGPFFIGFIHDLSGNWTVPTIVILVIVLIIAYLGLLVGKKQYIYE
jgi:CP family cyanate transporter-like MFS transporter